MTLDPRIRKGMITLVLFTLVRVLQAQTSTDPNTYILPSPTAMMFRKFGDYPVDYSTGVPQISIPIYTIQYKDYSFPISASFHASGRTTSQTLSVLGMNWALMANGLISVEVRGRKDGTTNYHLEKKPDDLLPIASHYDDVTSIDPENTDPGARKDTEYDIYSLSINGVSAKFIIRNGVITYLTYCPYKITGGGGGFIVTDEKGIIYSFGADADGNGSNEYDNSTTYQSAWYIGKITTPSGGVIKFKYDDQLILPGTFLGNRIVVDQLEIKDYPYEGTWTTDAIFYSYYPQTGMIKQSTETKGDDFSITYLKEIDFDNGTINFTYNSSSANFLLDRVKVTSSQGEIVKNAQFSYFQIPGTDLTLKNNNSVTIKNICFQDKTDVQKELYGFDYYPGISGGDFTGFLLNKDWWGYCNSTSAVKHFPFSSVTVGVMAPGGSYTYNTLGAEEVKNPNFSAKLPGMVKAIHYPTGGTSVFTYEPNSYSSHINGAPLEGPGIRVKQIINYDGFGHKTGRTYEYGPGYLLYQPDVNDYYSVKYYILIKPSLNDTIFSQDLIGTYRDLTFSSDPNPEAQAASRYPVYYGDVTEYDFAEDGSKNGRTIYSYSLPSCTTGSGYLSPPGQGFYTFGDGGYYPKAFTFNEWSQPQYEGKTVQKYDAVSGTYKNVSQSSTAYVKLNDVSIPQTYITKYLEFPAENGAFPLDHHNYQYKAVMDPAYQWPVYNLLDKTISCAIMKPQSETNTTYDDNGNQLSTYTNYYYDNLTHVQPTRAQTTTSEGRTIIHYLLYPPDYPAGTAFIDTLMAKHMWSPVIEEAGVQTVGGVSKVISGKITTYNGTAPYQLMDLELGAPLDIASFKFSNRPINTIPLSGTPTAYFADSRYVSKMTFNNVDSRNNPLTITSTDNIPVSYVWGYNQAYPIAHVSNAIYTDIFYTGFEETEGNSTAGDCWLGKMSRTGGYVKTVSGLQNGTYTLSYWQKSGSTWVQQNSTVNVTGGSYVINLTGQVDEVRLYPSTAQMTSYTYSPLVGMTGQSDIRNLPVSYEYDSYQRLLHIRDKDNNILKKYDYSFSNPAYYSTERTIAVTKNDCDPLVYLGQSVNYTVPEYMFSSTSSQADADSKRDAFIAQTSQAYANAHGVCYNYQNVSKSQVFTRACDPTLYGTSYTYTVPAGTYTALSQAAADQKALDDISANGQAAANSDPHGACLTYEQLYKSGAVSHTFVKNCSFGYSAPTYTYSLPYAKWTSANSQNEADSLANVDLYTNGQNTVDGYSCTALSTTNVPITNNTYYSMSITFSTTVNGNTQSTSTTVPAQSNGSITVIAGYTYTVTIYPPNSNSFHYYMGSQSASGSSATFTNISPAQITITN